MDNKPKYKIKSNSLYLIYKAMALDLLFFTTYYSIFFKDEKGFANSDINAIGLISALVYILLEPLFVKIIPKIGNTKSLRIGNALWLVALTLMAFMQSRVGVYLGYIIYQIGFMFKVVEPIILRNNLRLENRESDFSYIEGNTYFLYSIITSVIMLITGFMYSISHFSIVYAGYLAVIVTTILSFVIKDETEYLPKDNEETQDNTKVQNENPKEKQSIFKVLFSPLVMFIFLSAFLYQAVIGNSFTSSQMLLKDEHLVSDTFITLFIFFGRVSRILAALLYAKLYKKLKNKLSIVFHLLYIVILLAFMLSGFLIENSYIRFAVYVILIIVMYALRDPFVLYIQDTIFKYVDKENQRTVISINSLFYKLGNVVTCLVSLIILKLYSENQSLTFGYLSILIFISLIFAICLYKTLKKIDSKPKVENLNNEEKTTTNNIEEINLENPENQNA